MSKLTVGMVAAGAVLASAAAFTLIAGFGGGGGNDDSSTGVALPTASAGAPARTATSGDPAAPGNGAGPAAARATSSKVKAQAAVKPVRSVALTLPTAPVDVSSNVTGQILVVDTAGKTVTPVEGAPVALQQMRGKSYQTIADGVTDDTGAFPVAFMSKTNNTWRAELTLANGKKVYSKSVATKASALVRWASRPDLEVAKDVATPYSFRIGPVDGGSGHLEIANAKTPNKWTPLKGVSVPSAGGVVTQSQKFPSTGTWLLRGAAGATATTAPGYTTVLTVEVS
jgi:hypothetical protein